MLQKHPTRVLLITPKGTVIIARRLHDRLEARMQPDDLGLLRDFDWWRQLGELVHGILIAAPVQEGQTEQ
jgi:hypothetical protein